MKKKVLFICTHNSARSQMAEAFLNAFYGDRYEALSAGVDPTRVNPKVVTVMAEIGFDLSKHRSKSMEEFHGMPFDMVITLCDHAKQVCPFFSGKKILHKNFDDPSKYQGNNDQILEEVRRIRDEIRDWTVKTF